MWKPKVILMIFWAASAAMLNATAQTPDVIHYKNMEHMLLCNPLDLYFKLNPSKKPDSDVMSSSNWRGYVAAWEIKNQRLCLTDITVEVEDEGTSSGYRSQSVFREVFPGEGDVAADWFDGLLIIPRGNLVNYVHMGYASAYEQYIVLRVAKGEVIREKRFSGEEYQAFRKRQFEAFKQSPEYNEVVAHFSKNNTSGNRNRNLDAFLFEWHLDYTVYYLTELE